LLVPLVSVLMLCDACVGRGVCCAVNQGPSAHASGQLSQPNILCFYSNQPPWFARFGSALKPPHHRHPSAFPSRLHITKGGPPAARQDTQFQCAAAPRVTTAAVRDPPPLIQRPPALSLGGLQHVVAATAHIIAGGLSPPPTLERWRQSAPHSGRDGFSLGLADS
jgi:hypothetical protein